MECNLGADPPRINALDQLERILLYCQDEI